MGLTGSALDATNLAIIIAEIDREMNALLQKHGLTTGSGDLVTAAALCIGKALLIDRGLQTGDYGATAGKAEDAALQRRVADEMIGTYAAQSTAYRNAVRVYKVNG